MHYLHTAIDNSLVFNNDTKIFPGNWKNNSDKINYSARSSIYNFPDISINNTAYDTSNVFNYWEKTKTETKIIHSHFYFSGDIIHNGDVMEWTSGTDEKFNYLYKIDNKNILSELENIFSTDLLSQEDKDIMSNNNNLIFIITPDCNISELNTILNKINKNLYKFSLYMQLWKPSM